ncbi:MAG: DNA-directed RNA polymerase subunit beta' [Bacilli bacterium]|jgi:DNA-directed RNA polymerase subunit beta'
MFDVNRFAAIQVGLASPEKIREWSHGEVTKPETINYRSQKPERDGLFCERIFGPSRDYECYCGKYKKMYYRGFICEKCGVEITTKSVRRERMGHIDLAAPVAHIWYLKGIPSRMAQVLNVSPKDLEEVIYFISRICLNPGTTKYLSYREILDERKARESFCMIVEEIQNTLAEDDPDYARCSEMILKMKNLKETFDFYSVSNFINKYTGAEFGVGAEAVQRLLREVDIEKEFQQAQEEYRETQGTKNPKRAKLIKRLEVLDAFRQSENKPEWMVLDVLPVLPPELRPMLPLDGGRFAASDMNDLYRRVISRNLRLKKLLEIKAPSVILMNEKRMLQEAVDALIDNGRRAKAVTGPSGRQLKSLSHSLKGKQGRFRQNLLGKRVDYSGRSVIVVGPDLKMDQCGIPREMAIQLFKPFIVCKMIKQGLALSSKNADRLIERYDDRIWGVLDEVIIDHPVLLNRAPTLHRLGIQAFEPKLVDGRAIRLHPLVCAAFNADFDGDQMAVHVPLSNEAIWEARNLMLGANNILGPKDGKPIVTPSQDMVLGNYYLTSEETAEGFQKQAEQARKWHNVKKAERYELYAQCEGKVFGSPEEAIMACQTKQIHIQNRIAIRASAMHKTTFSEEQKKCYLVTTVGKLIFNQIFPEDFPYINCTDTANIQATPDYFFLRPGENIKDCIAKMPLNSPFKKKELGKVINAFFGRYGTQATSKMLDMLKDQGFKYATFAAVTVSLSDIVVMEKKEIFDAAEKEIAEYTEYYNDGLLTDDERHNQVIKIWSRVKDNLTEELYDKFAENKRNPIFMMADSGARGDKSNFAQLAGMRGLMNNPTGEIIELPIKSSFREGLNVSEYFISTHGARKGGADTALKTAESGYLTRRLVDVAHDVIVREEDCHTDHGTMVSKIVDSFDGSIIEEFRDRLIGRYAMHDIISPKTKEVLVAANEMINEAEADAIIDSGLESVEIRTLFSCKTKEGVCKMCYGRNLATGRPVEIGEAVGVMAAQSIGEPGTQLTLRTFHTGGVAGGSDITRGLPRVQELFEARNPKGEALITEISGEVASIEEKEPGRSEVTIKNDFEEKKYLTPFNAKLKVAQKDKVQSGQMLTEGAINPKQLLDVTDVTTVENYLLKEVQKVYRPVQGIEIADKHIEVIIRQMFRKVSIIDGGDTNLLPGRRVSLRKFTEANRKILLEGKRPAVARPIILGITKASLETDSFLSAASFQETTRVLADATTKGKTDYLHGLKENVIIGKLIPAGTGLCRNRRFATEGFDEDGNPIPVVKEKVEDEEIETE